MKRFFLAVAWLCAFSLPIHAQVGNPPIGQVPGIAQGSNATLGALSSDQMLDAANFPGAAWTDKVVSAYGSPGCSSGCTIVVPDSIAGDGSGTTPSIPANVTLVFPGSATFTFCQVTIANATKIFNHSALLQMKSGGSGCAGIKQTTQLSLQTDDKSILDGVRVDCNSQPTSTGITLSGGNARLSSTRERTDPGYRPRPTCRGNSRSCGVPRDTL